MSFVLFSGMCELYWLKLTLSVCGVLRRRFGLDESGSMVGNAGDLSGSGVGNLMGDLFPFVLCVAVFSCEEGDSNFVEVD